MLYNMENKTTGNKFKLKVGGIFNNFEFETNNEKEFAELVDALSKAREKQAKETFNNIGDGIKIALKITEPAIIFFAVLIGFSLILAFYEFINTLF